MLSGSNDTALPAFDLLKLREDMLVEGATDTARTLQAVDVVAIRMRDAEKAFVISFVSIGEEENRPEEGNAFRIFGEARVRRLSDAAFSFSRAGNVQIARLLTKEVMSNLFLGERAT